MTEKTYLDPDEEELRFLTKFAVSSEKLTFYGIPPLMRTKSELIKTLMDKLDTKETNILAESIPPGNKKSLEIVWLYLNQQESQFKLLEHHSDLNIIVQIWPWLNYFDVPYDNLNVKSYVSVLVNKCFNELIKPENKSILDDLSAKIKYISQDSEKTLVGKLKKHNSYRLTLETSSGHSYDFAIDKKSNFKSQLPRNGIFIDNGSYYVKRIDRSNVRSANSITPEENNKLIKSGYKLVRNVPIITYKHKKFTHPVKTGDVYYAYEIP